MRVGEIDVGEVAEEDRAVANLSLPAECRNLHRHVVGETVLVVHLDAGEAVGCLSSVDHVVAITYCDPVAVVDACCDGRVARTEHLFGCGHMPQIELSAQAWLDDATANDDWRCARQRENPRVFHALVNEDRVLLVRQIMQPVHDPERGLQLNTLVLEEKLRRGDHGFASLTSIFRGKKW